MGRSTLPPVSSRSPCRIVGQRRSRRLVPNRSRTVTGNVESICTSLLPSACVQSLAYGEELYSSHKLFVPVEQAQGTTVRPPSYCIGGSNRAWACDCRSKKQTTVGWDWESCARRVDERHQPYARARVQACGKNNLKNCALYHRRRMLTPMSTECNGN
jgi:hypothetical protein